MHPPPPYRSGLRKCTSRRKRKLAVRGQVGGDYVDARIELSRQSAYSDRLSI